MQSATESSPFGPLSANTWIAREHRPGLGAIDDFARGAQAIAEGSAPTATRLEELAALEEGLERCFHGDPTPAFAGLHAAMQQYALPVAPFQSMLVAFRAELTTTSYATFSQLKLHCEAGANPIGQLVLLVYGERDSALHRFSDALCTGLRLTAALRDVRSDLARGRCTTPQEDLIHFGVDVAALAADVATPSVGELMQFQATRARSVLQRGTPLLRQVGDELRLPLTARVQRGLATLDKIGAA